VQVKVQRANLPTFFARIWGRTGSSVSATAVAEAFNSSNSGSVVANGIVPVQPRCVKPWIVPNFDPLNPSSACTNATCNTLASTTDGSITHPGISLGGSGGSGVIGEQFVLIPDCKMGGTCMLRNGPPPVVNRGASGSAPGPPNLEYLPGQVSQSSTAVPSDGTDACSDVTSNYAQAIAGCDQSTVYQCGVASGNTVDLSENPRQGDTANGVQCLIHQGTLGLGAASGQDTLDDTNYPFQIKAGDNNPLKISGNVITSSNSVVTVPIYDNTNNVIKPNGTSPVTIVGFLQVFINGVDTNGNVKVTVLNVTGCSNSATNPVFGSSPVPVRLITPP
jgi:hypothetical protein